MYWVHEQNFTMFLHWVFIQNINKEKVKVSGEDNFKILCNVLRLCKNQAIFSLFSLNSMKNSWQIISCSGRRVNVCFLSVSRCSPICSRATVIKNTIHEEHFSQNAEHGTLICNYCNWNQKTRQIMMKKTQMVIEQTGMDHVKFFYINSDNQTPWLHATTTQLLSACNVL